MLWCGVKKVEMYCNLERHYKSSTIVPVDYSRIKPTWTLPHPVKNPPWHNPTRMKPTSGTGKTNSIPTRKCANISDTTNISLPKLFANSAWLSAKIESRQKPAIDGALIMHELLRSDSLPSRGVSSIDTCTVQQFTTFIIHNLFHNQTDLYTFTSRAMDQNSAAMTDLHAENMLPEFTLSWKLRFMGGSQSSAVAKQRCVE